MSDWIERHSVTCRFCGKLADERETIRLSEGEAHQECWNRAYDKAQTYIRQMVRACQDMWELMAEFELEVGADAKNLDELVRDASIYTDVDSVLENLEFYGMENPFKREE